MASECHVLSERRREIRDWYSRSAQQSPNELLGVGPEPEADELRSAFVRLAKRFHPDTLGPGEDDVRREMQAVFVRINEAFEALRSRATSHGRSAPASARGVGRTGRAPDPPAPIRPAPAASAPPPAAPSIPPSGPASPPTEAAPADTGDDNLLPVRRLRSPGWRHDQVDSALAEAAELLAQHETEAAIEALHEVLALAVGAGRRRVRALLAEAYLSEKRFRRNALSLLDEAVREDPGDASALAILGRLYLREGLLSRAEGMLHRAVRADPQNASALADLRAVRGDLARRRARVAVARDEQPGLVERILTFSRLRR